MKGENMKQQKHGNVGVSSHENVVGMHIDPLREPQAKLRLNLNGTMGKFQKALKLRFPSQLVIELRARPPPLGSWGLLLADPRKTQTQGAVYPSLKLTVQDVPQGSGIHL
jgi:hypothetical protein